MKNNERPAPNAPAKPDRAPRNRRSRRANRGPKPVNPPADFVPLVCEVALAKAKELASQPEAQGCSDEGLARAWLACVTLLCNLCGLPVERNPARLAVLSRLHRRWFPSDESERSFYAAVRTVVGDDAAIVLARRGIAVRFADGSQVPARAVIRPWLERRLFVLLRRHWPGKYARAQWQQAYRAIMARCRKPQRSGLLPAGLRRRLLAEAKKAEADGRTSAQ